jgi:ubiquinol-cytochrome c reductase cytochrome c1 subunit
MRTEDSAARVRNKAFLPAWALLLMGGLLAGVASFGTAAADEGGGADWTELRAGTSVEDTASVQQGARNFTNFCLGCHSLQYARWSRVAEDLKIPPVVLEKNLLPPGDKPADYITTSMPAADAVNWFGKTPPDLTLMVRARGRDYIYQFLKTFYVDPAQPTGANNLRLPNTAMPAVLSDLEGPKRAVFKNPDAPAGTDKVFDHFEQLAPGRLSAADYDTFVRDTVNFLDYVSEPAQMERRSVGIWVVLFLLAFTWIAWLMKKEYWKDVH